jgi:hypothetical protein
MPEEAKTENKPVTKHKLPEGVITPVELHHRLKKETNPETKEPYAPQTLNSQLVYTLLKAAKTNGMPVKHYDAEGKAHDEPKVSEHGVVLTRPGFKWEEASHWWAHRPPKQSAAPKPAESANGEEAHAKHAAPSEEDELDELEGSDEDDLVEAE